MTSYGPERLDPRPTRPTGRGLRLAAVALSTATLVTSLTLAGGTSVATPGSGDDPLSDPAPAASRALAPGGIDGEALRQRMINDKAATSVQPRTPANAPRTSEQESATSNQRNDRIAGAQRVTTPERHDWDLRIDGSLDTKTSEPTRIVPNREDDGAIPLARDLKLGEQRPGVHTTGRIGDGPHGSSGTKTGDYDFHRIDAAAGDTLTVDVDPSGDLVPHVLLYDGDGHLVVGAQDMTGSGTVHLSHPIENDGAYYLAVGNYLPDDPFDPASGPAVITEGPYGLDVHLHTEQTADTDLYLVPLRQGDVFGATVTGSARRLALHRLDGSLVQASAADSGLVYPDESPLQRGGHATANHVVDETGLYVLAVSDGSGDYSVAMNSQPAPSTTGNERQTVLLDFTGPTFDNRGFGGAVAEPGIRDVSPLRDFLPRWGLRASDERAVIEATTERVRETLRHDIAGSKIRVVTSLQKPDLFGKPGVSRVIIGGTPEEAGIIPAFGMSESVDPGNFEREDTAIVMPELMSGNDQPMSLNQFLTSDSDRIRAVAEALANTTSHEIGHYLGNYHTDDHDVHTSVMNTGNELHMFALGPDGVAGTADDDRIAMRVSRYDPLQGIAGTEDTPGRTRTALR